MYVIIFSLRQAYSHLRSDRNESENYKIAIITGHTVIYQPQHSDDFEWFAVSLAIIIYYFKYQSCLIYMYKHNPLHMYTTRIIINCFINDRENTIAWKYTCTRILYNNVHNRFCVIQLSRLRLRQMKSQLKHRSKMLVVFFKLI